MTSTPSPAAGPGSSDAASSAPTREDLVAAAVAGWRRELAELGGPNSLIWFDNADALELTTAHPTGLSIFLAGGTALLRDLYREPSAFAEARRRLRRISGKARELRVEHALPSAFLASGMATWSMGQRTPQAPVLLRSLQITPTDRRGEDFRLELGRQIDVNPALVHLLRSEHSIEIDEWELVSRAGGSAGYNPYPVYDELRALARDVPGFEIVPRSTATTLTFAKLGLIADVATAGRVLAGHDLIAALAGDRPAAEAISRGLLEPTEDPDPAHERLVLDADPDQQAVVDALRTGGSLAVTAAPGTGATQLAANLAGTTAASGRPVLVVGTTSRSLDDLLDRLAIAGLGEIAVDTRLAGTDRSAAIRGLRRAVAATSAERTGPTASRSQTIEKLRETRAVLREHHEIVHEVRDPWGISIHDAQQGVARLAARRPRPTSTVRLTGKPLAAIPLDRLAEITEQIAAVAASGGWRTDGRFDPWFGSRITTEADAERARAIVERLADGGLVEARAALDGILAESNLPPASTATDWTTALTTMQGVRATLEVFRADVFDVPLDEPIAGTASREWRDEHHTAMGLAARMRARSQARSLLRPGTPPADLHAELVNAAEQRRNWHLLVGAGGRPEISPRLDEALDAHARLVVDLDWLEQQLPPSRDGTRLQTLPLAVLDDLVKQLDVNTDRLAVLPLVTGRVDALNAAGLGPLVEDLAARGVGGAEVPDEVEHVWLTSVLREIAHRDERYGRHDGSALRRATRELASLEHDHLELSAAHALALIRRNAADAASPNRPGRSGRAERPGRTAHGEQSDLALLLTNLAGPERCDWSLADVLAEQGPAVLTAAPVWVASPHAVVQAVPPGVYFDLVIVLDAHLTATSTVIPALARGTRVVAIGDPAGVGPSNFVTAWTTAPPGPSSAESPNTGGTAAAPPTSSTPLTDAARTARDSGDPGASHEPDDADDTAMAPGVLGQVAATFPTRRLRWQHVAPRDLLANAAVDAVGDVMDDVVARRPVPIPVRLVHVEASAAVVPGAESIETTVAEVDAVSVAVRDLVVAGRQPLVVALNETHANAIRARLTRLSTNEPRLAAALPVELREMVLAAGSIDPRRADHVIVSTGYGKTPHGRMLFSFGPLGGPDGAAMVRDGARRARQSLTVVTSLRSADLVPERLRSAGPRALRRMLSELEAAAAEPSGQAGQAGQDRGGPSGEPSGEPSDAQPDALVADLAARLRAEGLWTEPGESTGALWVDLVAARRRPDGSPVAERVAVLTDGAASRAHPGVRERERLIPQTLERQGFVVLRVWQTDLFRDPAREVARVVSAAREAARGAASAPTGGGAEASLHPIAAAGADDPRANDAGTNDAGTNDTSPNGARADRSATPSEPAAPGDPAERAAPTGKRRGGARRGSAPATSEAGRRADADDAANGRAGKRRWSHRPSPEAPAERGDGAAHDDWLNQQRPPHWE